MLNHLLSTLLGAMTLGGPADTASPAQVHVQVDSASHEIVISVRPLRIAPATPYTHHADEAYHTIPWPATGWVRGYRIDLLDSTGRALPRELLHHAGMANLDRRQIAYPNAERAFAAAHETTPVVLPGALGLPLTAGQRMVLYYALVNPGQIAFEGAVLQVRIRWATGGTAGVRSILPFYANAKENGAPISFDVPPGMSTTSAEFSMPVGGWLRMLGGHLHDHGVELRLEDAETQAVLARLRAKRAPDGRLLSVSRTRFLLKRRGLRLDAGRRYRIVAIYDNPTGATLKAGAMGFVAGAFIPDDIRQLETIDATDPAYQKDVRVLLGAAKTNPPAANHGSHH